MDIQTMIDGFLVAIQPANIWWLVIGAFLGTVIGILPGLGPATGIAVLIPLTFGMDPVSAIILMAAIYYGAMYGGSRSSILINTPGDGSAIAATFDGYPLAKKGRAGPALAMSAVASFIGGIIAVVGFIFLATPLANFALKFGPSEYFFLLLFALIAFVSTSGTIIKAYASVFLGLLVGTIGIDLQTGTDRFTFGVAYLGEGINFIVVIIGLYAVSEVFYNMLSINDPKLTSDNKKDIGKIWFSKEDWKRSKWPILRSGPLGFIVGVLPGAGAVVASLMSYTMEKKLSKRPEEFGKGAIEGLAAPESANNSASVGALIPMLTLGVPGSGATAVMLGALIMIGITPGPLLFKNDPELVTALVNSMFIGNVILVIINIVLISLLTKVLSTPPKVLYPLIIILSFVGAYSLGYSTVDLYILIIFGVLGLLFKILDFPVAPFVLALIVGADMEKNLRRAINISDDFISFFTTSNITIVFIILTLLIVIIPFIINIFVNRKK